MGRADGERDVVISSSKIVLKLTGRKNLVVFVDRASCVMSGGVWWITTATSKSPMSSCRFA